MSDKRKDARFTFRFSGDELRRLEELAQRHGVKLSVLVRRAVSNLLRRAA